MQCIKTNINKKTNVLRSYYFFCEGSGYGNVDSAQSDWNRWASRIRGADMQLTWICLHVAKLRLYWLPHKTLYEKQLAACPPIDIAVVSIKQRCHKHVVCLDAPGERGTYSRGPTKNEWKLGWLRWIETTGNQRNTVSYASATLITMTTRRKQPMVIMWL